MPITLEKLENGHNFGKVGKGYLFEPPRASVRAYVRSCDRQTKVNFFETFEWCMILKFIYMFLMK